MLGKSLPGPDKLDPVKAEEPLDAAEEGKLASGVQELAGVLWEKSCIRLLHDPAELPALLSDPVFWLPWLAELLRTLEFGVLAGVEGPLVKI